MAVKCLTKCSLKLSGLTLRFNSIEKSGPKINLYKNNILIADFLYENYHLKLIEQKNRIKIYTLKKYSGRIPTDILTFAEATETWNLSPATLRMAVSRGTMIEGYDYRKSGQIFLTTTDVMTRRYGTPKSKDVLERKNGL